MIRRQTCVVAVLPILLSACAAHHAVATIEAPAPAPVAIVPPPTPPVGLTASLVLPPVSTDGGFVTINSGLTSSEAVWHLRSALNVAALGCRGAEGPALIAGYNQLLKAQKTVLAAADKATQARYRETGGKAWQDAHDQAMTRLYNFFAQPFAQARFCATAQTIMESARAVPAGQMEAFAASSLAALEAPFTDFYREAADYRRRLALWQAGQQSDTPPQAMAVQTGAPRLTPVLDGLDRVAMTNPR